MIASLAGHGIARTRRGFGSAGCFAAAAAAALLLLAGCALFDGPVVTVENHSSVPIDDLWVVSSKDSVRVPTLAPGASARVRPHVSGEDVVTLRGRAGGRPLSPALGAYVEPGGGYRLRAVVNAALAVTITETKVGGAAY